MTQENLIDTKTLELLLLKCDIKKALDPNGLGSFLTDEPHDSWDLSSLTKIINHYSNWADGSSQPSIEAEATAEKT